MAEAALKLPSLADIDALPAGMKGEIIEGVLYTMTRPRAHHQRMDGAVIKKVGAPFDDGLGGPGGWWILPEPGIELPMSPEFSPDVAGWRRERLPALPKDQAITVVPDWICEILSPSTRRYDLTIKKPYYARIGVRHLWLVDLEARIISVLRLEQGRWVDLGTFADETDARMEPFDAVAFDVHSWWDGLE
ncbi:MAG: Uma2 family endonuclease [Myxococcales bacterium]